VLARTLESSDFSDTSDFAITKLLQKFVKCVRFGARVQGGGFRFAGSRQVTRIEGVSPVAALKKCRMPFSGRRDFQDVDIDRSCGIDGLKGPSYK
jgi:hypothetical protein